ncbi:hypothetical protein BCU90_20195 [Vibrio lentus]|uniref:hypothetical protein n=1 Tax=Vibrio lentus TaxID=136468 RepID=UPI000C83A6F3|nr:hypothetical protein [Vibrio lentus]MCZ8501032.1 hypothetical protein [Vibrio lentus]PMG44851.1 hypothetical protein BCU90_20195 [Vibrio lentus]
MDKYKNKTYGIENSFLAKPFLELSEKALKIRRNLNVVALIAIAITLLGIEVKGVNFSGLKIEGLTDNKLYVVLLCVLLYHMIYFLWCTYDEYWKWRIHLIEEASDDVTKRQTGDYSLSPSQLAVDSNLYCNDHVLENIYKQVKTCICSSMKAQDYELKNLDERLHSIWCSSMQPIIEQDLARLRRYEQSFKNYHMQEVARFSIIEFGLPLVLSLYGAYELALKLTT